MNFYDKSCHFLRQFVFWAGIFILTGCSASLSDDLSQAIAENNALKILYISAKLFPKQSLTLSQKNFIKMHHRSLIEKAILESKINSQNLKNDRCLESWDQLIFALETWSGSDLLSFSLDETISIIKNDYKRFLSDFINFKQQEASSAYEQGFYRRAIEIWKIIISRDASTKKQMTLKIKTAYRHAQRSVLVYTFNLGSYKKAHANYYQYPFGEWLSETFLHTLNQKKSSFISFNFSRDKGEPFFFSPLSSFPKTTFLLDCHLDFQKASDLLPEQFIDFRYFYYHDDKLSQPVLRRYELTQKRYIKNFFADVTIHIWRPGALNPVYTIDYPATYEHDIRLLSIDDQNNEISLPPDTYYYQDFLHRLGRELAYLILECLDQELLPF